VPSKDKFVEWEGKKKWKDMPFTELKAIKGYSLQGGTESVCDLNFFIRPKMWGRPPHYHDHMQFLIVLDGTLCIEVERAEYVLTEGDCSLIPPGICHSLYTESGYTQAGINFYLHDQTALMGIVKRVAELDTEMVFEKLAFAEKAWKLESLLANGNTLDIIEASVLMCEGLIEVLERMEYGNSTRIDRQISGYMEMHVSDKLQVEDMARHFNMSPSMLQRICHRYFDMSIMNLYNQKRLNKAIVLLHSTDNNINEIANVVGFEEVANFSAFFKKKMGETPSSYRKRILKKLNKDKSGRESRG